MMSRRLGVPLIFLTLVVTLVLFLLSKVDQGTVLTNRWLVSSQLLALWGAVLMSLTMILSGKIWFVENLFGGYDKVYRVHHRLGMVAFILLISHPILLALGQMPKLGNGLKYLLPTTNLIYSAGVASLYLLTVLLILTVGVKLPYQWWKATHQLMGTVMFLAIAHVMFIESDVSRFWPLKWWMLGLMAFGLGVCWYYKILYPKFGPNFYYKVKRVAEGAKVVEIEVEPEEKRTIRFLPGQFALVTFESKGLLKESHPFSFASSPDSKIIRFGIKKLGDYSSKLGGVRVGDRVRLQGPYGKFGEKFFEEKEVVAISGGIGITPFIGLLEYEANHPRNRKIYFFSSDRQEDDNPELIRLKNLVLKNRNIEYFKFLTLKGERLTAVEVAQKAEPIEEKNIFICGPFEMTRSLWKEFIKMGVDKERIYFEDFSFKQ